MFECSDGFKKNSLMCLKPKKVTEERRKNCPCGIADTNMFRWSSRDCPLMNRLGISENISPALTASLMAL
jgi:hypothetical protein